MRIIVTGGSGFVGRNLIPKLLQRHSVINLDLVPSTIPDNSSFRTPLVDIRDYHSLKKAFDYYGRGCDAIIHLAALSREKEGNDQPFEYFRTNIGGTLNLLQLARDFGINKFIFASSFLVYGMSAPKTPEFYALSPRSVYAATKVAGEALIKSYSTQSDMKYVILRKCNIYGRNDSQKRIIDILIERARDDKDITLFGDKVLDFVHIDDVVNAYCSALEYDFSTTLNIGSGKSLPLKALAKLVIMLSKTKSKIRMVPANSWDVTFFEPDITNAQIALGYRPSGDIGDFIAEKIKNGE